MQTQYKIKVKETRDQKEARHRLREEIKQRRRMMRDIQEALALRPSQRNGYQKNLLRIQMATAGGSHRKRIQ